MGISSKITQKIIFLRCARVYNFIMVWDQVCSNHDPGWSGLDHDREDSILDTLHENTCIGNHKKMYKDIIRLLRSTPYTNVLLDQCHIFIDPHHILCI